MGQDSLEEMREVEVTICPYWDGDMVSELDILVVADQKKINPGDILFRFQKETVTIPFCPVSEIRVEDEKGEMPYSEEEWEEYPVHYRAFVANREGSGKIKIFYHVKTRDITGITQYGPYFDLRSEKGGANGAGVTCMPLLPDGEYQISLKWNMKHMPPNSRGIWSFGEGDQTRRGKAEMLLYTFYAVGMVQSVEKGDFGFYWFGTPPFDVKRAAENVKQMYFVMSRFFEDTSMEGYRVFARKDPFEKSGGTALSRSFLFGYNDTTKTTVESLQNLLAHEMVHNWPHMDDHPYGSCTWFTEGCAEFYSVMLPLRANLVSLRDTLEQIQKRTDEYFTNPTVSLSNEDAAKLFWKDRRTQRISYGRGFFFLANVDSMIRKVTNGEKSVDDVVKPLTSMYLSGKSGTNEDFIRLVNEVAGVDISGDFEKMEKGERLVPDPDGFDGHFSWEKVEREIAGGKEKTTSYQWKIKIGECDEN